jgi:tetrahydromethanopterin S-methyltransferase subunit F
MSHSSFGTPQHNVILPFSVAVKEEEQGARLLEVTPDDNGSQVQVYVTDHRRRCQLLKRKMVMSIYAMMSRRSLGFTAGKVHVIGCSLKTRFLKNVRYWRRRSAATKKLGTMLIACIPG